MVDALERSRGRYAGVGMVTPSVSDAELGRLHDAGVRGARFNFVAHLGGAPDMEAFWTVLDRVAGLGWHVVLHFDAQDLPAYAEMLGRMPAPYVIDHMARIDAALGTEQEPFQRLCELMLDERAWVKVSGAERLSRSGPPGYDDVVPFARALISIAPDRVLWGTDWPHPNVPHVPDDGDLVDLLAAFAPDEAVRTRILVRNPERLYDFG
jgi:predicted TIM-barrel fold metal-dependent hydrolase